MGPVQPSGQEPSGQESCRADSHGGGGASDALAPGWEWGHPTGFPDTAQLSQKPHCKGPCSCWGSWGPLGGHGVSGACPSGSPAHCTSTPRPVLLTRHHCGVTSPRPHQPQGTVGLLPSPRAHMPPYLGGCGQQQGRAPACRGGGGCLAGALQWSDLPVPSAPLVPGQGLRLGTTAGTGLCGSGEGAEEARRQLGRKAWAGVGGRTCMHRRAAVGGGCHGAAGLGGLVPQSTGRVTILLLFPLSGVGPM